MLKSEPIECLSRPLPLSVAFMAALAVHLPLLLMKLPLQSYDTNFHIFFSSHYVHHWFDPWNTKWFAGFSQTTYPPMPHYWIAVLSRIMGLDLAYMTVQLVAILLLVIGVYRFSLLWVNPRAASIAASSGAFAVAICAGLRPGGSGAKITLACRCRYARSRRSGIVVPFPDASAYHVRTVASS